MLISGRKMPMKIFTFLSLLFALFKCDENNEYILNTTKCKIPQLDVFHHETSNQNYLPCNSTELLTYVKKINDSSALLILREELIPQYSSKKIRCCYSYVTRQGTDDEPDVGINLSECEEFQNQVLLTVDTVKVICTTRKQKVVYENVHNAVLVTEAIKEKMNNFNGTVEAFSVLLVVVDSVSRLNMIRTMPQTYRFLKNNNFIELKGYTKVGDNTFPNCMALLTGENLQEAMKKCVPYTVGGLDNCSMIWYDYRNSGYITAYAEDNAPIATFNYLIKGFKNPPTDYYFKPYIEASETLKIKYHNYMPYCTGPETSGERILNLAKDFSTTFKNHPNFGIFWMNTFSHDEINAPSGMDSEIKKFFKDLKRKQIFNKSIVIFLSDHGIRFGDIRLTQGGWFEERMPMNMISVPPKFQEIFKNKYENLRENSNKLVSTYDMFLTLQEILSLSSSNYQSRPSSACSKCLSIFEKIPANRSCKDAGIPAIWCTCGGHYQPLNLTSENVNKAVDIAIKKINAQGDNCQKVSLSKILSASVSESFDIRNKKLLFIVFQTEPLHTILLNVKFHNFVNDNSTFYLRRTSNDWSFCFPKISE